MQVSRDGCAAARHTLKSTNYYPGLQGLAAAHLQALPPLLKGRRIMLRRRPAGRQALMQRLRAHRRGRRQRLAPALPAPARRHRQHSAGKPQLRGTRAQLPAGPAAYSEACSPGLLHMLAAAFLQTGTGGGGRHP